MWRMGDLHSCPLMATEHRSNLDCVEYAVTHGDVSYDPNKAVKSGFCDCALVPIPRGLSAVRFNGQIHYRVGCVDEKSEQVTDLKPVVELKLTDYLPAPDMVAHPAHYTSSPAKCSNPECRRPIECIDVTKHMNFSVGSMVKYLWRLGLKGDRVEQLRKVIQYAEFEIGRIEQGGES